MTDAAYVITMIIIVIVGVFTVVGLKDPSVPGEYVTVRPVRSPGAESRAARDRLALLYEVHSWAECETCGLGPPPLDLLERGFAPSIETATVTYGRNFEFHKRAS